MRNSIDRTGDCQGAPTDTPWGVPDTMRAIAPGIVSYSTPSHGGMWLSDERRNQMPDVLRSIGTWAGPGWYEEDCDWSIVVCAFPQYFPTGTLDAARGTLAAFHTQAWREWIGKEAA